MKKVLVLGASGMLGDAVAKQFEESKLQLTLTARAGASIDVFAKAKIVEFEVDKQNVVVLKDYVDSETIVVNCIGKLKSQINEDDSDSIRQAIQINSIFPHELRAVCELQGAKVIQIATDCVFSGKQGFYGENDPHDATDVYGKTKSLGQVASANVMNLGCSIIGTERVRKTSLLEWVVNQLPNAHLTGFTDHFWNGITTHAFAKIVVGIVKDDLFRAGTQHVVPSDVETKDQIVRQIAQVFNRHDLKITSLPSGVKVDRSLKTNDDTFNRQLWFSAGYSDVPSIAQLIAEIA